MAELFSIRAPAETASARFVPLLLPAGEFLAPVTLEAVRATIYFDGATLFGASLEPANPVRVNQAALPGTWTKIPCPARLELGDHLLVYEIETVGVPSAVHPSQHCDKHWDTQTVVADAIARPPAVVAPENPFEGRTAIWAAPEPQTLVFSHSPVEPPSRHMTPERSASLRDEPPVVLRVDPEPPSLRVHPKVSEPSTRGETTAKRRLVCTNEVDVAARRWRRVWAYLRRELQATPKALRWTLLALPAVAWLALERSPPPASAREPHPAEQRAAASAASHQKAQALGATSLAAAEMTSGPTLATIPSSTASARPRKLERRKRLTLEARAADAAARGAYAEAVALYQELADLHPDRPEFTSAARILRAR